MTTKLLVSECISFGWNAFKSRPWFFVGTMLIYAVAQVILSGIQDALDFWGFLLSVVLGTLFYLGFVTLFLKAHDNVASAQYKDLWNPEPFWRYLGLSVLLFVIVFVGLILLIVPGVFAAIVFSLSGYLAIEKGMNPIEALKESMRLTRGNRWKLFLLGLAIVGLTILGMIPLFLGLLIVGPVAMLASVHAYRVLAGKEETIVESPAAS